MLTINEQGLVAGDEQIRTVRSHPDFRTVFVLSERTYSEQGKDVSRALRNRCQELWINFNSECEPEHGFAAGEEVVASSQLREGSADWQLYHLQAEHDLVPFAC